MKYEIHQLREENLRDYGFMNYVWAVAHGFDFSHYEKTYEGEINASLACETALEMLFRKFNIDRPSDFKGRSLSMSDIVIIDGEKFYCDSVGWRKLD